MTPVQTLSAALEQINRNWAETFGGMYDGGIYTTCLAAAQSMPPVGDRKAAACDYLVQKMEELLAEVKSGQSTDNTAVMLSAYASYISMFKMLDAGLDLSIGEDA